MRSNTPSDREMFLRTRERPDDRRDNQERHLQLLLQEVEELNARLRERLASSQNWHPQRTCASIPTASRGEAEPSTRGPRPDEARAPQRKLEPRKRQRESQKPQDDLYERRPSRHTASSDGLSKADSSRTSPREWENTRGTEASTNNMNAQGVPKKDIHTQTSGEAKKGAAHTRPSTTPVRNGPFDHMRRTAQHPSTPGMLPPTL